MHQNYKQSSYILVILKIKIGSVKWIIIVHINKNIDDTSMTINWLYFKQEDLLKIFCVRYFEFFPF